MNWADLFATYGTTVLSRGDLLAFGATGRSLTAAVRDRFLVRVRRGHYALPSIDLETERAIRVGGRMTCVTALSSYGVFAFDTTSSHVQVDPHATRLRTRYDTKKLLNPADASMSLHWSDVVDPGAGDETRVGLQDALVQSAACRHPWHLVASIDNAWHEGLLSETDVADVCARLPGHRAWVKEAVDPRAESGQETVLKMIARDRGLRCEPQVKLPGLGRVDHVVEGVLMLEADSRAHHDGGEHHVEDRHRDLIAAGPELASLRPAYQHTMHHPDLVGDAVKASCVRFDAADRTR